MKKFRYDYVVLGIVLAAFAHLTPMNWELYAILIPFAIINTIWEHLNKS